MNSEWELAKRNLWKVFGIFRVGCTRKLIKGRDYPNEETRMNNGQIRNHRKLKN